MAPYIPQMVTNIAKALGIKESQINVKATTEEGLGFTGEGQGIAAKSVCLLMSVENFSYYDSEEESNQTRNCSTCSGCSGCSKK